MSLKERIEARLIVLKIKKMKYKLSKKFSTNENVNPLKLKIGRVQLTTLKCRCCNQLIPSGSNCVFTRWTWAKYCLECGKKKVMSNIEKRKKEIKNYRYLLKGLDDFNLVKANMCVELGK